LARARELLRERLVRRGVALSVGALITLLTPGRLAAVPAVLREATAKAALRWTAGANALAGAAPAPAAAAGAAWGTLVGSKWKLAGAAVLAVSVAGTAGGALVYRLLVDRPAGATRGTPGSNREGERWYKERERAPTDGRSGPRR